MTIENILVLAILFFALILFVSEKLRVDVVAMLVLAALIVTGLVTPEEAFSGFSSPAVITVGAVFIISGALYQTGIADAIGETMLRFGGSSPLRVMVIMMVTVGVMSAFMNNIGAVAILLPAVITISEKIEIPPSKLLMPLAFAALLGGNMTLIGTPPNILANDILIQFGGEPFGFFDFLPMGLIVLTAGILYMVIAGRHLLPARHTASTPSQSFRLRPYLTEVRVNENSILVDKSLAEAEINRKYALNVIHIVRDDSPPFFPGADRPIRAGDILLVEGQPLEILNASTALNLLPVSASDDQEIEQTLAAGSERLVEVTLSPRSDLEGKTLKDIDFRARFDLVVLAIRHQGRSIITRLPEIPLSFGDALLVQGEAERIEQLRQDSNFLILDTPSLKTRRLDKAPLAAIILIGALIIIITGWLSPAAVLLIAALLMILTGILRMDEAYEAIDWRSIFLIAGILPLGIAMETSGTAVLIADQIVALLGDLGPRGVMIGLFIMTALLTEVISNAAATVLVVPIAIDIAFGLNVSARTYVMAVVLAASTSFLMPIGHQVNVLIFGPGGYRFSDYPRVGIGLNLIILLLVALFLPLVWPF
ncbi:MAG: SLC13 family permease [Candidatus Promineifilaceae bacterium]